MVAEQQFSRIADTFLSQMYPKLFNHAKIAGRELYPDNVDNKPLDNLQCNTARV